MDNFLFVNTHELSALMDLPLIQRVAYLMGVRPYMDRQTRIVGIKRKISYQSLREVLYVAPIPGVKTEYPSLQQARRVIKSLERAGLVTIQSTDKNLILKCILAEEQKFVQNKADIRPTSEADIRQACDSPLKSKNYKDFSRQTNTHKMPQADTPHNNNYLYLLFEKFWESYPQKKSKPEAQAVFEALNPDNNLFQKIIQSLNAQVQHHELKKARGEWVPAWKYPAKWLELRCWEDEIFTDYLGETNHGMPKHQKNTKKREAPKSMFWIPDDDEDDNNGESNVGGNVIAFQRT